MGFLDGLRKLIGGQGKPGGGGGGRSSFGDEGWAYWLYVRCQRCGEPLRARVDLRNEPSEEDDGGWVVRKGLTGSGKYYCFQTVEVTLHFDQGKKNVLDADVVGGKLITAEDYATALPQWQEEQERLAAERAQE